MAVPFLPYIGKKGKSLMGSDGAVPWYDRPARAFPAQRWVWQHYGFCVPPLRLRAGPWPAVREFPARRWLRLQQMGG
jgi:hypothetical protein